MRWLVVLGVVLLACGGKARIAPDGTTAGSGGDSSSSSASGGGAVVGSGGMNVGGGGSPPATIELVTGDYLPALLRRCVDGSAHWLVYQAAFPELSEDVCTEILPSEYFRAQVPAGDQLDPFHEPTSYDLAGADAEYCVAGTCTAVESGSITIETGGAGEFKLDGEATLVDGTKLILGGDWGGTSCPSQPFPSCWM
jgi:hypothetical protein